MEEKQRFRPKASFFLYTLVFMSPFLYNEENTKKGDNAP